MNAQTDKTQPKYKTPLAKLCSILLVLIIAGCSSLNSQVLDLHPKINASRTLPADTRIQVIPNDLRKSPIIGYRHTGKTPEPNITLQNSHALLQHTAEHALLDMGVKHFSAGEFTLDIALLDLNYKVNKKTVKQTVNLDMRMRIKVSKGNKSYTGNYASTQEHIYLKTPSADENKKIIGGLVSETMNRAFNDPQLLDFIQFN